MTILATSVFERMCAADPQARSRLRPCGRRLVSADSSPLTVKGELQLNVVFPGLSFDMLFVVASIGSDGLLGTEALQSCLPHQLDLWTGQLWAEGRATLQLHQQRPIPEVQGLLRPNKLTILVLVSVSLKKWHCCANFYFIYFLARVESRYFYACKYLMVYDQYKFHLSIVCDM